jgi:GTPase Era involved in 16S rRNA processing
MGRGARRLHAIYCAIFVERESQKKIIIGHGAQG